MIQQLELLEQIFLCLPVKSIARFRSVSKSWNSLFSQPLFIKTHLRRIQKYPIQEQSLVLVSDITESLYTVKLNCAHQVFDEMPEPPLLPTKLNLGDHRFTYDLLRDKSSSCDGLVLVEDTKRNFVLMNPTTREFKELPETLNDRRILDWITLYGIGYDSFTDDYKVVNISYFMDLCNGLHYEDDDHVRVNVYSVKNGTWKTLDNKISSFEFDYDNGIDPGGVYLNGHIHWIARNLRKMSTCIVAFDLKNERFRELPALPSSMDCMAQFVIIGGYLCVPGSQWLNQSEYKCVCAVMTKYNVKDSWVKFTIVDHEKLGVRPLCFMGKAQLVLLMDEDGPCEKLAIYNVKEKTFKEVEIQGFPDELTIKGTFVESLLSPHYVYKDEGSNVG